MINVVCAVIQDSHGRVLACRRPEGKLLAGKWEFPGGKIEQGEQPEHALVREIAEELNCGINAIRQLEVVTHDYETFSIRLIPFLCTMGSEELSPTEHTDVRWVELEECRELDWAAADVPIWSALLALS